MNQKSLKTESSGLGPDDLLVRGSEMIYFPDCLTLPRFFWLKRSFLQTQGGRLVSLFLLHPWYTPSILRLQSCRVWHGQLPHKPPWHRP